MRKHGWFLLILLAFFACSLRLVNRGFYYDECFAISNFLFAPLGDIAGKYMNLNNHVLFSLVNALYLRLIGVKSIGAVLTHPWVLRLPQGVFALSTLILVYKFGLKHLNKRAALLAVLLLATTIPFYYYTYAIRGYGLSMALMMGLVYLIWEV